jgi:predicted DNA-binding transcriptional regulator AlpA
MTEQILLKPNEVSKILGVEVETLNVWRSNKRYNLPYIKIGSLVRYRKQDIDNFIQARTNGQ